MAKRSKKSEAVGQQVATSEPDSIDAVRILEMPESCKDAMLGELGEAQRLFAEKPVDDRGVFYAWDPIALNKTIKLAESKRQEVDPLRRYLASIPARENIIFSPRVMMTALGSGSELAKLAVEDRYMQTGPGNTVVGLGSINLVQVQKKCCELYGNHPLAKNVIKNLTMLTIGEGCTINFTAARAGRTGDRTKEKWASWETAQKFQPFIRLCTRMLYMLGEGFVVAYPLGADKATSFRWIEPDRIDRIFYDAEDIKTVIGYELKSSTPGGKNIYLRADDVWHLKIDELGNVPRGIPRLLPVLVYLRYWSLFVENRHWINMVRARIPLVRTVKGSGATITREKSRISTLPGPGTVQFDAADSEWKFPAHNIGASDVVEDRKLIEAAIASGVSMPVFLVTNDLSTGNYASGVLAESPLVRDIEDVRDIIREMIEWMVVKVMGQYAPFAVQYPPVVRRNFADVAAGAVALVRDQVWSRRTAAEATGRSWHDRDGERERIMAEEADGFVASGSVDPFNKQDDGGVGAPTTGTAMGGSSRTKAAGGDGEG